MRTITNIVATLLIAWSAMTSDASLTRSEIEDYYRARVPGAYATGDQLRARCPIHNGKSNTSFAVDLSTGRWYCHSTCGRGGDIFGLEQELSGSHFPEAKAAVYEIIGRPTPPAMGPQLVHPAPAVKAYREQLSPWRITATYTYLSESGDPVFRAVRREKAPVGNAKPEKKFSLETPKEGGWDATSGNMEGVARVPYRLPQLLQAKADGQRIYVVEGEKAVESLVKQSLPATCNPQGAGKWNKYRHELNPPFIGATLVILPDNDDVGRKHALSVADQLLSLAKEIRIVELPDLPDKGDVVDWLATGCTAEDLERIANATPALDAAALAAFKRAWTPEPKAQKVKAEKQDSPAAGQPSNEEEKEEAGPPDHEKEAIRRELTALLQTRVLRFVKVGTEAPCFQLITKAGTVHFDTFAQITSQAEFRSMTAAILGHAISYHKNPEWVGFVNLLLSIQEVEEADPESQPTGSIRSWLVEYLANNMMHASWEDVLKTSNTDDVKMPHIEAGAICVCIDHFKKWAMTHLNERLTYNHIANSLSNLGGKKMMRYRHRPKQNLTFYKLPAKDFPPADFETDKTLTTPAQEDATDTAHIV